MPMPTSELLTRREREIMNAVFALEKAATDQPPLFSAIQEQLGLKLESERGPVDVIVIDHVERPTED